MAFIRVKTCLTDPKQLLKFILLVICVCITLYQLAECIKKIITPPVSTYYKFLLNETIKYPAITICRRPSYKNYLFSKYGISPSSKLNYYKTFQNFPFDKTNISTFLNDVTYDWNEVIPIYGYKGVGFSKFTDNSKNENVIEMRKTYLLNNGLCYTLDPKVNSDTFSISGGFFFQFSHSVMESDKVKDSFGISTSGFDIYMHGENEIVTGEDNQDNSLMEYVYLETCEDMSINLKLQTFSQISSRNEPCIDDVGYSKSVCEQTCIHQQIAKKVGCTVPWLRIPSGKYSECSSYESIRNLISYLNIVNSGNSTVRKPFLNKCKHCKIACKLAVYSSHIQSRKEADILVQPGSSISIYFSSNLLTQTEEVVSYDWNVFLADVGGSLGFLLGLSVIGILTMFEEILRLILKIKNRKRAKRSNEEQVSGVTKDGFYEDDNTEVDVNVKDYLADCEAYAREANEIEDNKIAVAGKY